MKTITGRIAAELGVDASRVAAAVELLDDGATVPFIARYRKEKTGSLDDTQLRLLEQRLDYLRELESRREAVLNSIEEQGKLDDALRKRILAAETKTTLEDLYLPYKPKRRNKAAEAREAGLEPLADCLFTTPDGEPESVAAPYVNAERGIADAAAALEGARNILMERFSEDADLLNTLRETLWNEGRLVSTVADKKESEAAKFSDYFEHSEPLNTAPSHRALAMFRGRRESLLTLQIVVGEPDADPLAAHPCEGMIARHWGIEDKGRAGDRWLRDCVRWTWRVRLAYSLESDCFKRLRERAEEEAIQVFSHNMKDLLLAAPAGGRATLGMDPGLRTGVKMAVVDATGKVLEHAAIFPHAPQHKEREAAQVVLGLLQRHGVELIAIGNGTAGRETERFIAGLLKGHPDLRATAVMVNEAGASVYSASEYAAREFPDLDVTVRGAVSIARRLQDPLAELVKIEPKAIGVGQYQHDVSQLALSRSLDGVVEDCVNAVGVDVNTASSALLAKVSGLSAGLAAGIVDYRDREGAFRSRKQLQSVPRFGEKTFEQAAGFLRLREGDEPLDASAVHPESYPVVERIARGAQCKVSELLANPGCLKGLQASDYVGEGVGLPTVQDIFAELEKPGRDPRPAFETARFKEGVETLKDLQPGMTLEGAVTNVTNFGAFVDIGVHQDGLVHISMLADRFVKDPREVVKAGDVVKVKVMSVDQARKRVALSMRLDAPLADAEESAPVPPKRRAGKLPQQAAPAAAGAMASAFAQARRRR